MYESDLNNRFWSKVTKKGPENCWLWKGSIMRTGYGNFTYLKTVTAHRMAWKLTNGDIPYNKLVLHKCDTKLCCNPNHLYLGTYSDNMSDRASRNPNGQGRGQPKLYAGEIWLARKIYTEGKGEFSQAFVGKMFKVGQRTINRIVNTPVFCKEGYYV